MMEDRPHAHAWLLPDYGPARQAKLAAWRALAAKLRAEGHAIFELSGDGLLGEDGEATTDGSHPSDLGAMRYAEAVVPVLAALLSEPRTLNPPSGT
jgi:lysophospholipase L1-like esterase